MKIRKLTVSKDGWEEARDSALVTIHSKNTGKAATYEWKMNLIRSEHSPLRENVLRVVIDDVPRWVADQFVRHNIGFQPYMGTWRPDRGAPVPREEQRMTDLTVLKMTMNFQAVINVSKERLCIGCVSKETREIWETILEELFNDEPELVFHCVPSCVYRFGCKEFKPCGHFKKFLQSVDESFHISEKHDIISLYADITERYSEYHFFRKDNHGRIRDIPEA